MKTLRITALVLLLGGCFAEEERAELLLPLGLRPIPVDQTLPGELAEGEIDAFGLMLPRKMRVLREYPEIIHAEGRVTLEDLSNYVRDRVEAEKVETGPTRTLFRNATIDDAPEKKVIIELSSRRRGSTPYVEITVRKVVPPPQYPPLETDAQRWERVGLTPDGKVLDKYNQ